MDAQTAAGVLAAFAPKPIWPQREEHARAPRARPCFEELNREQLLRMKGEQARVVAEIASMESAADGGADLVEARAFLIAATHACKMVMIGANQAKMDQARGLSQRPFARKHSIHLQSLIVQAEFVPLDPEFYTAEGGHALQPGKSVRYSPIETAASRQIRVGSPTQKLTHPHPLS
jgi:hypothetical protein